MSRYGSRLRSWPRRRGHISGRRCRSAPHRPVGCLAGTSPNWGSVSVQCKLLEWYTSKLGYCTSMLSCCLLAWCTCSFLRCDIPLGSLRCDGDLFFVCVVTTFQKRPTQPCCCEDDSTETTLEVASGAALASLVASFAPMRRCGVAGRRCGVAGRRGLAGRHCGVTGRRCGGLGVVVWLGVVVVWLDLVVVWRKNQTATMQRGVILSFSIKLTSSGRSGGVLVLPGRSCIRLAPADSTAALCPPSPRPAAPPASSLPAGAAASRFQRSLKVDISIPVKTTPSQLYTQIFILCTCTYIGSNHMIRRPRRGTRTCTCSCTCMASQ